MNHTIKLYLHNLAIKCSLILTLLLVSSQSQCLAKETLAQGRSEKIWKAYKKKIELTESKEHTLGLSYMISGGVATLGGIYGYYNSQDPFARGVYAIAQSIGIGAIGYGAFTYWIGDDQRSFYNIIENTESLSNAQRVQILRSYLQSKKRQEQKSNTIKAITHGALAIINGINASKESNQDVRTVLYFLGGINLLASLSYTF